MVMQMTVCSEQQLVTCVLIAETFFCDGVSAAGRLAGPGVGEVPPALLMCYKPPSCELA